MKARRLVRELKAARPSRRLGKALGVFALGAALGSICGILFAPASGQVTRKRIGMQFRSAKKQLGKKLGGLKVAATEKMGETRDWLVQRVISSNGKHPTRRRVHA